MSNSSEAAIAWRIDLTVPEVLRGEFEALLEERVAAVSSTLVEENGDIDKSPERLWRLSAYCADASEGAALTALLGDAAARLGLTQPDICGAAVAAEDWAAKGGQEFPLLFAGRFVVHGAHLRPSPGRVALCINSGNAFGSGLHGSTRGCLLALDGVAAGRPVQRALDLGAGSGILSMAIAKRWSGSRVVAADIDPAAVAVSGMAGKDNGVSSRVRVCVSDGFAAADVRDGAPYDLICANILANPLCRMALEVARHLAPGGLAILSGLLRSQEEEVVAACKRAGLRATDQIRLGDWSALLLTT